MLIGDKETFAVECYHEPLPNEARRVFGRMCIWVEGECLGDIDEPACMLNVTELQLENLLLRLESLDDPALRDLGDREAFDFLNHALYVDDTRTDEQVSRDAKRFFKFDLLTNGGESFDRSKSFIIGAAEQLRVMFEDDRRGFSSGRVDRATFIHAVRGFLAWVAAESQNAGCER